MAVALREYVELIWGWDEARHMTLFQRHWNPRRWEVVTVNGQNVGGLSLETRTSEFYISNIELMPEHQGRGIGSAILRDILGEAERRGWAVALQVFKVNGRARELYERLGFRVTAEGDTHFQMRAEPRTSIEKERR